MCDGLTEVVMGLLMGYFAVRLGRNSSECFPSSRRTSNNTNPPKRPIKLICESVLHYQRSCMFKDCTGLFKVFCGWCQGWAARIARNSRACLGSRMASSFDYAFYSTDVLSQSNVTVKSRLCDDLFSI
jgi:hypothetical protein